MNTTQEGELSPLAPHPIEVLVFGVPILVVLVVVLTLWIRGRNDRHRAQQGEFSARTVSDSGFPGPSLPGVSVPAGAPSRAPLVTPAAAREEKAVRAVRGLGLLLGLVAAVWSLDASPGVSRVFGGSVGLGVEVMLAPIVFGLVVLVVVLIGELVVRPRLGAGPRTADLRPRRVRDHLPRRLTVLVGGLLVAGLGLCAFTWSTAGSDDLGRSGRALSAQCSIDSAASRGPYPGSFYLQPYLVGLALALVLSLVAAWWITRRTLGGTPAQTARHRDVGVQAVVGAFGIVLSAPLCGLALTAASALLGFRCPQAGWTAMGWFALAVGVASMLAFAASVIVLLAPMPRPSVREQTSTGARARV